MSVWAQKNTQWLQCNRQIWLSGWGNWAVSMYSYQLTSIDILLRYYLYNRNPCSWKDSLYIETGPSWNGHDLRQPFSLARFSSWKYIQWPFRYTIMVGYGWETSWSWQHWFNSLAPGRFQRNFRKVIFQLILVIDGWSISCKIVLKWLHWW